MTIDLEQIKALVDLLTTNKLDFLKVGEIEIKKSKYESIQNQEILPQDHESKDEFMRDLTFASSNADELTLSEMLSLYPVTKTPKGK